jgi:hypothetical protein
MIPTVAVPQWRLHLPPPSIRCPVAADKRAWLEPAMGSFALFVANRDCWASAAAPEIGGALPERIQPADPLKEIVFRNQRVRSGQRCCHDESIGWIRVHGQRVSCQRKLRRKWYGEYPRDGKDLRRPFGHGLASFEGESCGRGGRSPRSRLQARGCDRRDRLPEQRRGSEATAPASTRPGRECRERSCFRPARDVR